MLSGCPTKSGGSGLGAVTPCNSDNATDYSCMNRAPSSSSSSSSSGGGSYNYYLFVMNEGSSLVHGHAIDMANGGVNSTHVNDVSLSAIPLGEALNATSTVLYVVTTDNMLHTLSIAADGSLTEVAAPGVETGSQSESYVGSSSIAVHPNGHFLFVSNYGDGTIEMHLIDPSTGLPNNTPVVTGGFVDPAGLSIDPSGNFLYVADVTASLVYAFKIDQSNGTLTAASTPSTASDNGPVQAAVDPTGNYVYTNNWGAADLSVFSFNSSGMSAGSLTNSGSSSTGIVEPITFVVDPLGRFLYVVNAAGTGTIAGFNIGGSMGSPLLSTSISLSSDLETSGENDFQYPTAAVIDPDGAYLYVLSSQFATVSVFSIDAASGALTEVTGTEYGDSPFSICITPIYGVIGKVAQ